MKSSTKKEGSTCLVIKHDIEASLNKGNCNNFTFLLIFKTFSRLHIEIFEQISCPRFFLTCLVNRSDHFFYTNYKNRAMSDLEYFKGTANKDPSTSNGWRGVPSYLMMEFLFNNRCDSLLNWNWIELYVNFLIVSRIGWFDEWTR